MGVEVNQQFGSREKSLRPVGPCARGACEALFTLSGLDGADSCGKLPDLSIQAFQLRPELVQAKPQRILPTGAADCNPHGVPRKVRHAPRTGDGTKASERQ